MAVAVMVAAIMAALPASAADSGTTLELAKPLPPMVTSCHVAYSRESASPIGLPSIKRSFCQ
jgi:hypothetical protein